MKPGRWFYATSPAHSLTADGEAGMSEDTERRERRGKPVLPAAIFLMLIFACGILYAGRGFCSGASPTIYLEPASSYIKPGQSCTLSVMVDDAMDSLSCVFCVVAFDSEVVKCSLAEEGSLYVNTSYSTFFNWELIAPDSVKLEDCVLGYRSFILAPGELYALVFEGVRVGTSPVRIARAEVYNIDRESLPVNLGIPVEISVSATAGTRSIPSAGIFYCYPNPFNPATTLTFYSPADEGRFGTRMGELLIYSALGGVVRNLYSGWLKEGRNEFLWNGKNDGGRDVSSGVYIAVLKTPDRIYRHKMVLVR